MLSLITAVALLLPAGPAPTTGRLPHYQAKRLDGTAAVKLRGAAKGKPVMVHLWAAWCIPCLDELPVLEPLAERWRAKGLAVYSVALDANPAKPRRIADEMDVPGVLLHDPTTEANLAFGVDSVPATFLYDRTGKLVWSTVHPVNPKDSDLLAALRQITR